MNFIRKLQTSEAHIKFRWLIGSSAIVILLVVFVWLNYFNTLVQANPSASETDSASQGLGFWQTFKGGLRVVSHGIGDKFSSWYDALKSPRSYEVK